MMQPLERDLHSARLQRPPSRLPSARGDGTPRSVRRRRVRDPATLLIIDVTVRAPEAGLGHAVLHDWPEYAAYIVSFVTIGIMWINHHACMRLIDKADRTFMVINLLLLMCIAFVPSRRT